MARLTEMEAFAHVVRLGGFTDAATHMGISKSAMSKQIASLEARLGITLLERTTRRVAPTPLGLAYYERVKKILADVEAAEHALNSNLPVRGRVSLAAPVDYGRARIVPLLPEFTSRFPDVEVTLDLGHHHALPATGDVAIVPTGVSAGLHAAPVAPVTWRLVASPDYLQRGGAPARIDDLTRHALLHDVTEARAKPWRLLAPTGEARVIRGSGPIETNDVGGLLTASLAGVGIAHLPCYVADEALAAGALVHVLPALPPVIVEQSLVCRVQQAHEGPVRELCGFLSDRLG